MIIIINRLNFLKKLKKSIYSFAVKSRKKNESSMVSEDKRAKLQCSFQLACSILYSLSHSTTNDTEPPWNQKYIWYIRASIRIKSTFLWFYCGVMCTGWLRDRGGYALCTGKAIFYVLPGTWVPHAVLFCFWVSCSVLAGLLLCFVWFPVVLCRLW